MFDYKTSRDEILDAMDRFGGSFVQQLAVLYRHGDEVNRRKLEVAFHDEFVEYDEMAVEHHDR